MNEDRIEMSQRERDRLKVMAPVLSNERTATEAARLLELSVRQVRRLRRRLEAGGDAAIIHGLRGRPSDRRRDERLRRRVVAACRGTFAGLGPTMAAEKLAAIGLAVPKETLMPAASTSLKPLPTSAAVAPADQRGLVCRHCGCEHFRVIYTRPAWGGRITRRRECRNCGRRMTTWER